MTVRPTAEELLDAVREHLATKVLPAITDKQLKFQTLVATHVIGVVVREQSSAETYRASEWQDLAKLLGKNDEKPADGSAIESAIASLEAELSTAIREGKFDRDEDAKVLIGALTREVENALQAWNPMFLVRVASQT